MRDLIFFIIGVCYGTGICITYSIEKEQPWFTKFGLIDWIMGQIVLPIFWPFALYMYVLISI